MHAGWSAVGEVLDLAYNCCDVTTKTASAAATGSGRFPCILTTQRRFLSIYLLWAECAEQGGQDRFKHVLAAAPSRRMEESLAVVGTKEEVSRLGTRVRFNTTQERGTCAQSLLQGVTLGRQQQQKNSCTVDSVIVRESLKVFIVDSGLDSKSSTVFNADTVNT